jgi:hypothetical protein
MTKRTLIVALAVALALIGTGCNSSSSATPDAPVVSKQATNDGGTLNLSWDAVEGATSYEITAGASVDTTDSTSFDVTTPAATIEVRSVNGNKKSDPFTVDCKIVESTVEFFGDVDLTHPNGFGFGDDGSVVGCTLSYPSNAGMDFYADSSNTAGVMKLVVAKLNQDRVGDAIKAASGSYDGITIADPLGTYSGSWLAITVDSTYYLRMSADTSATWSTENNFAKANVVSIEGDKVTLKTAYQKIGGLRWLAK